MTIHISRSVTLVWSLLASVGSAKHMEHVLTTDTAFINVSRRDELPYLAVPAAQHAKTENLSQDPKDGVATDYATIESRVPHGTPATLVATNASTHLHEDVTDSAFINVSRRDELPCLAVPAAAHVQTEILAQDPKAGVATNAATIESMVPNGVSATLVATNASTHLHEDVQIKSVNGTVLPPPQAPLASSPPTKCWWSKNGHLTSAGCIAWFYGGAALGGLVLYLALNPPCVKREGTSKTATDADCDGGS
eukprot:TRINITY_DN10966_c0_g1_i1.p1 TRINITY_DN10966_c0_g1~~TRINITY_DN10966_c0_g1_i1.p1  ORF type:complete len:251 (-),score=31.65 TRINITY_DN10966_c0_g1_i1:583-1335(-)